MHERQLLLEVVDVLALNLEGIWEVIHWVQHVLQHDVEEDFVVLAELLQLFDFDDEGLFLVLAQAAGGAFAFSDLSWLLLVLCEGEEAIISVLGPEPPRFFRRWVHLILLKLQHKRMRIQSNTLHSARINSILRKQGTKEYRTRRLILFFMALNQFFDQILRIFVILAP